MLQTLTAVFPSYIFGAANVITIPMVWALYPETNQRTLEVRASVFIEIFQPRSH